MQHWDHICECKPSRHCLLYRHTLAELKNLVLLINKDGNAENNSKSVLAQNSRPSEVSALSKKVLFYISLVSVFFMCRFFLEILYQNYRYGTCWCNRHNLLDHWETFLTDIFYHHYFVTFIYWSSMAKYVPLGPSIILLKCWSYYIWIIWSL